jgi:hypothetical protein
MYHPIEIQSLSPQQKRKLVSGLPIRVKHGRGHIIHASPEQHKKIVRAHARGKAVTIQFDPFQAQQHGSGLLGDLAKKAVSYAKGKIRAHIPQAEKFVRDEIQKFGKHGQAMAEHKLESLGLSKDLSQRIAEEATGRLVRGAEHMAHAGLHHADKMLGEGIHQNRIIHKRKPRKVGGKLNLKDIGRKIKSGFQKLGHDLKPVGREIQSFARQHGRELLHDAVNMGVSPALSALSAVTGQPEIAMASPLVQSGLNQGLDALGNKYGFRLRKKGRPRKLEGSALFPA